MEMPEAAMAAKISVEDFSALCKREAKFFDLYHFHTLEIGAGSARVRMPADERHVRPGGTISGPAQMALADFSIYAAVLGAIGEVPLAVTTSLNINFLNKPAPGELLAEARLLKLGKRLAMGEVTIFSNGASQPVSHVTATYSIPPDR